jgi:hypothetical protein
MHRRLRQLRLFSADPGAQGGAGGQGQGQGGQGQDQTASLQSLLARNNGDAMAMAAQLFNDNYALRERNRQLSAAAPAEGSVVLPKAEADALAAYKAIGDLEALKKSLADAQQAQTQLAGLQRQGLLREVAEAAGYKASVLGQLPGAADLAFEVREVEADGKKTKAAFVKPKDGAEVALTTYAQQHWGDFLPALAAAQQQGGQQQQQQGTPYPGQGSGGGQPPADPVAAFAQRAQQQRDAAPNPFAPKK